MVTLINSGVVFNEKKHTYTLNGKKLSGITEMLKRQLFANKYADVPPAVLEQAKLRGSQIHKEIENINTGAKINYDSPVSLAYLSLLKTNGIKILASEYIVTDFEKFASAIDIVDTEFNLYDIKATAELDAEYLRWQLSVYAYLFEKTNPELKAGKLFGLWVINNEIRRVEVERIDSNTIVQLFMSEISGLQFVAGSNEFTEFVEVQTEISEQSLELVVSEKTLGKLTTNATEIYETVKLNIQKYDVLNYGETNIDNAKKDKATLNKAAKMLNDRRIEFEKEFTKPFAEFKETVNKTVKLIKECSDNIDIVVKKFEEKEKAVKRNLITEYWNKKDFNLVTLNKIFNDSWLNKTAKISSINAELDAVIDKINSDIKTLEYLQDAETLKAIYLDTLNLNTAIEHGKKLEANRIKVKQAAEQAAKREAEIETENQAQIEELQVQSYIIPQEEIIEAKQEEAIIETEEENPAEELITRDYRITATTDKIIEFLEFLKNNSIKFEKL
ncbi:MAG: DUF1351 domain-containing protein [Prevotellaceae bacterium]|jgi:hypothetical protein|nr:DUF1351 domain-containing protein [Prevotellaceae bacterium]